MIVQYFCALKRKKALQVLCESVRASRRPVFLALQGIPGSGKSTVVAAISNMIDGVIVSLDSIRAELGNESDQSRNAEVLEIAKNRVDEALRAGHYCILDSTLVQRPWLNSWVTIAASAGADVRIVRVHVPLEIALQRNAARDRVVPDDLIRQMYGALEQFDDRGLQSLMTIIDNS